MSKQRIVVKVGTSTLTRENGALDFRTIDKLAQVLSALHNEGNQCRQEQLRLVSTRCDCR